MPKLISFSGGRSSAMMLKLMIDNGQVDDETAVVFSNTGKEMPETLDFVQECSIQWNVPVIWCEYIPEKPLYKIVDFQTAQRKGEPFEQMIKRGKYLPNVAQRICTGDLKIKVMNRVCKRHLKWRAFDKYMGIRFDEQKRYRKYKDTAIMPLYDMKITKWMVQSFWSKQPFDLQITNGWGNCDLCFQKGKSYVGKLIKLIRQQPERADWWIEQEERTGSTFIKDTPYKLLKHIALNQTTLDFDALDNIPDSFDCECGG